MNKIKAITHITSLSFTLVILMNTIFLSLSMKTSLELIHILTIFLTCFLIAVGITLGIDSFRFSKNHPVLYSFFVMTFIASGIDYLVFRDFSFTYVIVHLFMLAIVFIGVWIGVYGLNMKEAKKINDRIGKMHKRNLK